MKEVVEIKWLPKPEDKDYHAAESYLSLLYKKQRVNKYVDGLKQAPVAHFKAKDIFRASSLALLDSSNYHVKVNRRKISDGEPVSPILLVRDRTHGKVVIADGYHRLCAVYSYSEDEPIPCQIV